LVLKHNFFTKRALRCGQSWLYFFPSNEVWSQSTEKLSSVNVIIRLLLSEMTQPKVITLSGAYCRLKVSFGMTTTKNNESLWKNSFEFSYFSAGADWPIKMRFLIGPVSYLFLVLSFVEAQYTQDFRTAKSFTPVR
jgi:hypothetical protein